MRTRTLTDFHTLAAIAAIDTRIRDQLRCMADITGLTVDDDPFARILGSCRDALSRIARLVLDQRIRPWMGLRLAPSDPDVAPGDHPLRVGVFPTAADPLHWGHVLCALTGMAGLALDKVVFVAAGADSRKPGLAPEDLRHDAAQATVDLFAPLFACSPIARGTALDGEENLARLIDLNPGRRLETWYMAGTDHLRRRDARGEPDTVLKLERMARRGVHALFLARPGAAPEPGAEEAAGIDVKVLAPPALPFSSSAIRSCLARGGAPEVLAALPYCEYQVIRGVGAYAGG
jgi:hypothetical protein